MLSISRQNDAMTAISRISGCATENEVIAVTKSIVSTLGAASFVYTSLFPPDFGGSAENASFLIGCDQEWCNLYEKRMWIMNDPYLEYARSNGSPVVGSMVKPRTRGQVEMIRAGSRHGFRSGLMVPTHTSMDASKRLGLLYIGSDLPAPVGEPILLENRVSYSALGFELLHWQNARMKQQAMRKHSLLEEEIQLLQFSKDGKRSNEIAAILDLRPSVVYSKLNTIKEKFNVDKLNQAIMKAEAAGILG